MPKVAAKKTNKAPIKETTAAKEVKKPKHKDSKPNVSDKSFNVPVMRCISQLKNILNKNTKNEIENFSKDNSEFFDKEKAFLNKIKVTKDKNEKEVIKKEFNEWKNNDKNIDFTKKIQKSRKCLYRISGPASKYISQILEFIIRDMLKYGIEVSISNKSTKLTKLTDKEYKNINTEKLQCHPLIYGLKMLEDLQNDNIKKDKDDDSEDEKKEKDKDEKKDKDKEKQKPQTYQMVTHNIFKQLIAAESDKKLCCGRPCKVFISDLLMEVVDRFAFYLSELVGTSAQASTVNEKHVLSSCRLLFYNCHRNLDEYNKFVEIIDSMYTKRFNKEKTEK